MNIKFKIKMSKNFPLFLLFAVIFLSSCNIFRQIPQGNKSHKKHHGYTTKELDSIYSYRDSVAQTVFMPTLKGSEKHFADLIGKPHPQNNIVNHYDHVTIIGVGDIMLGTSYPSKAHLIPDNNCNKLLDSVRYFLQNADVTFANLEGPFSDSAKIAKQCQDPSKCYAFRTPISYFQCIVDAGFDVFSLANNHSGDCGTEGRETTIKLIEDAKLSFAGLITHPKTIFEKNGVKYGFCAFAPNTGTCDINNLPEAEKIVKSLADSADIVIVSFHGGAEGRKHQHVTRKSERFYGENRGNVYKFAHKLIDAGADVVFGHGPHVVRAMEIYNNRFIVYSLGNFCTYSRMNLSGPNALAPAIKVRMDKTGKFVSGMILSGYQIKGKGTLLDQKNRAFLKIKELTQADFPENNIIFENNGRFTQVRKKEF